MESTTKKKRRSIYDCRKCGGYYSNPKVHPLFKNMDKVCEMGCPSCGDSKMFHRSKDGRDWQRKPPKQDNTSFLKSK